MNNLKIGIVVADDEEFKPLAKIIESGRYGEYEPYSFLKRPGHKFTISTENGQAEVYSVLCGMGKVNAASMTAHFVDIGCNIILNYGLSGGISGISRGELMLGTKFLEHDFDLTGIGYKLCEKPIQEYIYYSDKTLINIVKQIIPDAKLGTAVSGDRFICDEETRLLFKNTFDAMSCDMETAAIAYVCYYSDVPFLVLRRVSDDAGEEAGVVYREMNKKAESLLCEILLEAIPKIIDSGFDGKVYE